MKTNHGIPARWKIIALILVLSLHTAAFAELWKSTNTTINIHENTMMASMVEIPPRTSPSAHQAAHDRYPPTEKPSMHPIVRSKPHRQAARRPASRPSKPSSPARPTALASPPRPQPVVLHHLTPSCSERTPPAYPPASIRLNEQGRVVLRVKLDANGRISNVKVAATSGFPRLDRSAIAAMQSWHCRPAMRHGVPVASVAKQSFNFVLTGN